MDTPILRESRAVIDLDAVEANYERVRAAAGGVPTAAMVKSDGYGLGADAVAAKLAAAGCSIFFVAQLAEGLDLRAVLGGDATIVVLNGALPGTLDELRTHDLIPVLNGLDQVERWSAAARRAGHLLPAVVQVDTGMHRLGLTPEEWRRFIDRPDLSAAFEVRWLMSHLASADADEAVSAESQRARFVRLVEDLPGVPTSLANSASVFLGDRFHFDLVRPGIALYGGSPRSGIEMEPVVTVEAPVVQVFDVDAGDEVGYGGTHRMTGRGRLATVGVGYGDGFHRSASGQGRLWLGGYAVPIVGRISMDLTTVDVTGVPDAEVWPGRAVEVIGPNRRLDDAALAAGTISYELLTDLGRRYRRTYVGDVRGGAAPPS